MFQNGTRCGLIVAAALAVASCNQTTGSPAVETAAAAQAEAAPPKPVITMDEARRQIASRRGDFWKDPYSIRDAKIGTPLRCSHDKLVGATPATGPQYAKIAGSCVCVLANAKNALGGYTGMERTVAIFFDTGDVEATSGGTKGFQQYCGGPMTPFPQLNGKG